MAHEFDHFTPEMFLPDVEHALGVRLSGLAVALPSYINRVYELETRSRERVVVKFYRPNRWTEDAILDEHDFLWDCDAEEIPVVPPYELEHGATLGISHGVFFAVFEKKRGRDLALESLDAFERVGQLLGRIHACGQARVSEFRMRMTPENFAFSAMDRLFTSGVARGRWEKPLMDICEEIIELAERHFPAPDTLFRIHGDFHRGNVLERPGEGLMAIDFDDMLVGPAVQDFWLLLPGAATESVAELNALLKGYRLFMPFDQNELKGIELFRAMRMMHYLSWCAAQAGDRLFHDLYPDWGGDAFWRGELHDFTRQRDLIREAFA